MELDDALRAQVEQATGARAGAAPIKKLKGDASNRSYYRVGEPPSSWVVMVMPPDASKKSEEATKGAAPTELPFVNVHRYLDRLQVRVPSILRYDEPAGMMVLEDLYDWELHHFREWGLEVWSGKKPTTAERAELDGHFRQIARRLAEEPRGFTHRDYQSRNIMVKGGDLVVIDFQDALLGPRQYDLVALLRDSYVELDWAFVDRMLDLYLAAFQRETGEKIDPAPFKDFFDLLTVQRKLKDAGRFEYINRVKGNPGFLVSIPASLRYVQSALGRRGELSAMRQIIARYVPEVG